MTADCAYDQHGPCPETAKTCECLCHWDREPPMTTRQKLYVTAFFTLPLLCWVSLTWPK